MSSTRAKITGFTLIELSIVLVIVGLIVGGVLVGQDLIRAAAERAQISQIEKYNTAVNTFYGKYGALPGDMPASIAGIFGIFTPRSTGPGQGDGNGLINYAGGGTAGTGNFGEEVTFWNDLGVAGLIEGSYIGNETGAAGTLTLTNPPSTNITGFFPAAKIGQGNFVYVWSGFGSTGLNYYSISALTNVAGYGTAGSSAALTVRQARDIDVKMDDGLPETGRVIAVYVDGVCGFCWGGSVWYIVGSSVIYPPNTFSISGGATTCFDTGGVTGPGVYSMEISNGSYPNCGLTFQFQ